MDILLPHSTLIVSQKKEWGETLSGLENENMYVVMDSNGSQLFSVAEEGSTYKIRNSLGFMRPFTMAVRDSFENKLLTLKSPFRFYFRRIEIEDANGTLLGAVERELAILRRIYTVTIGSGQERYQLFNPLLQPLTFFIKSGEQNLGNITKKWSGLGKEILTDADNFGVQFPREWDVKTKAVFLGAVFLIDFVHFERKG